MIDRGVTGDKGIIPVLDFISSLLRGNKVGICEIVYENKKAKFFVTGTSVFYMQPNFRGFPSRKIEMRDAVGSYLHRLGQIADECDFLFLPRDVDDVLRASLEWARGWQHVSPTYKSRVMIKAVSLDQWIVINETS